MSDQRPARTIYRSAAAEARTSAAAAEATAGRRRLRDAWWLAPVLALVILLVTIAVVSFFVLGGFGLLPYLGITSGQHFAGTWGSSDPGLGSASVHVIKDGGSAYGLSGVRILGQPVTTAQVKDDSLVASGTAKGVTWQLSVSFANREQLRARVDYGDGRPPLETLLTRQ